MAQTATATRPRAGKRQPPPPREKTDAEKELEQLRKIEGPTDAQEERISALAATVKTEAFQRLGTKRVRTALKALRLVKQLARPASYSWTAEQEEKILIALSDGVRDIQSAFNAAKGGAAKQEPSFEL